MRTFLSNTLAALARNPPKSTPESPPLPPARPNRRQRRQQELGQRRNQVQVNRALEQALVASKKKDTFTVTDARGRQLEAVLGIDKGVGRDTSATVLVTKDGDQYTVVQHEPTECHPTTPNDRD